MHRARAYPCAPQLGRMPMFVCCISPHGAFKQNGAAVVELEAAVVEQNNKKTAVVELNTIRSDLHQASPRGYIRKDSSALPLVGWQQDNKRRGRHERTRAPHPPHDKQRRPRLLDRLRYRLRGQAPHPLDNQRSPWTYSGAALETQNHSSPCRRGRSSSWPSTPKAFNLARCMFKSCAVRFGRD